MLCKSKAVAGAVAMSAIQGVSGDMLWPPSLSGHPDTWGNFDSTWTIYDGNLAAHSEWGGRTVAKKAGTGRVNKLLVHLSGTYNLPAEYSHLLKYSSSLGFDVIGLNYGWGPTPDSGRSVECAKTVDCDYCQENFHEFVLTGGGLDLVSGPLPVFGDDQIATLKWTHFFSSGVQFVPEHLPPPGVNLTSPMNDTARNYIATMRNFAIEVLLVRVMKQLGWTDYLSSTDEIQWTKIFITGHSQGASHTSYVAYRRPVLGALMFSGPQDLCGTKGVARYVPERKHIYGCYAVDEPGAVAIRSNLAVFREVRTINSTGGKKSHGKGVWCPPAPHCATAVDDQLVDESVEKCFSLTKNVLTSESSGSSRNSCMAWFLGALLLNWLYH